MTKIVRYNKTTIKRFAELLERIDWSIQNASRDGLHKRVHLPNGDFSGYTIFGDYEPRLEHNLNDFRGGTTFYFKDCYFEYDGTTVSVVGKDNKSLFISFHNFDAEFKSKRNISK